MSCRFLKFLVLTTTVFISIAVVTGQGSLSRINRRDQKYYKRYEVLDPERKYILEWEVNWNQRRILFNATVQARGYVGLGLSAKGLLDGADIVIGGVDRFGKSYFTDRHGVGNGEPRIDPSQDWKLHSARENKSHTFLSFSRAFDTCDEHDYLINERDTIVLIWAYSDSDDTSQFNFGSRGEYPVYFLDPLAVPRSLKEETFIPGPPSRSVLARENLRLWNIKTRFTMPDDADTAYRCTMQKAPRLKKTHHIVGYRTRLDPVAATHVHHIVLYRCTSPQNTTAAAFFERFVNHPGQECYFQLIPSGEIPTQYCTTIRYTQTIGMRIMFYPEETGMPIGDTGMDEYYVMQVHYDNPDRLRDVTVEVNVDVYYTNQLRSNEAGMLLVGHNVPGSPSILIPPNSTAHYIHSHCSPECTTSRFQPEGIFLSHLVLHTHNSGQKVRLRHFRGGVELPWVSDDSNYVNQYQDYRFLHQDVNIRPGDQLTTSCEYDNTWTNGSVVGGFTTKNEMCMIYIIYYNGLPATVHCRSEIINQEYMRYYLGVNNVTWDRPQLENVATSPRNLAGRSMSTISNSMDWDMERRTELQEDHRNLPQTMRCSAFLGGEMVPEQTPIPLATLPNIVKEYAPPPRVCPSSGAKRHDWRRYSHGPRIKIGLVGGADRKEMGGGSRFHGSGSGWRSLRKVRENGH